MRWACGYACVALAACGFSGNHADGGSPPNGVDARRIDADPDDPDASPPDANTGPLCPATYAPILGLVNTSLYRFVDAPQLSWINAENDCEDDALPDGRATHLAVLDDMVERDALIGGLDGLQMLNDQWLGLTDLAEEGTFDFVTNQNPTYEGTPTGNQNDEDCVRLKDTMAHEIRDCDETNRYVCECDGRLAQPSHFPNPPDGL